MARAVFSAYLFNLRVIEQDGRESYSVGPKEPEGASVSSVSRTSLLEGRTVRLLLRAWGIEWGVGS